MAYGVEEDFANIEKQINEAIPKVIPEMQEYIEGYLKLTIDEEVYDKYTPKVYERRSENPARGTPLNDIKTNSKSLETSDSIGIDYEPTGYHYVREWRDRNDDELIAWLETSHKIGKSRIPARPFWQEYVKDLENGVAEREFVRLMKITDPTLEISAEYTQGI